MKRSFISVFAVSLLSACVHFLSTYNVTDSSHNFRPSWISQFRAHKSDSSDEAKLNMYFVSDAQNVNQRLCLKSAETRAIRKIALKTTEKLTDRFEKNNKPLNNTSNNKIKEQLQENILVNLKNIVVVDKYWEKRAYKKEKGAEKDYTSYKCDVVVKIKKTDLAKALSPCKEKIVKKFKEKDKKAMTEAIASYTAELNK